MKHVVLISCMLLLNSCAAFMSATNFGGDQSAADISIGSTRAEVEKIFGMRSKTIIINNKESIDFYECGSNIKPSITRTGIHASLSAATKGVWEVFGIPIEEHMNRKTYVAVNYNNNIVRNVDIVENQSNRTNE